MADFNRIAPFYDVLKKIVFGGTLDKASSFFTPQIPITNHILIIGGGSGQILSSFGKHHTVTYVESSKNMIALAQKRKCYAKVEFIESSIEAFSSPVLYDTIITPFILDCFCEKQLHLIFEKLRGLLKEGGTWLHSDFYPQSFIQRKLTSLMYLFFQLSTEMNIRKAPDFSKYFQPPIFIEEKKALFLNAMVHSYIYRKIGP